MELTNNLQQLKSLILSWKNARYCSIISLLLVNIYVSIRGEIPPGIFNMLLSPGNSSTSTTSTSNSSFY